jgi:peptidoglycan hydrolase-like amidase
MKSCLTILALLMLGGCHASAQTVSIGVFGLFHPRDLRLEAPPGKAIVIHAGNRNFVLERSSALRTARMRSSGGAMLVQVGGETVATDRMTATSRAGEQVEFVLAVPEKIRRHYMGTLEVRSIQGTLVSIVTMDLETAVASAVQAESGPQTPLDALKAQAVATRSYMIATHGRHGGVFDFCDTTHCQYMRDPPARGSPADLAARSTRGMVLAYHDEPFPAMYTRSCSGQTRTPEEDGFSTQGYPYFSVTCNYCRTDPHRWQSYVSQREAAMLARQGEAARLAIGRRDGWDAVPGDAFTVRNENGQVVLEGSGEGHGIGLCQRGARVMSESGADFRQILEHYYPNTTIVDGVNDEATPSGLQAGN